MLLGTWLSMMGVMMSAGCAQSGVLELQLMLPPLPAGETEAIFAQVLVRRSTDHPFDLDWEGGDAFGLELGAEPRLDQVSVIGADPAVDLHIKVRFCRSPTCDAVDDADAPEVWVALAHPFYIGRRTAWATCIDSVPTTVPIEAVEVDRCDIRGCVSGASATYCAGSGEHFCETDAFDEPPSDLRCVGGVAEY